ncbi:MAG: SDR family NAD(P)-dependent oxidoreductase [Deltaproteobacteria bacterium]|nr:SDR family NAD(P)-dependent oxidoreductase [Deltaproteobacteria bacterium]
MAGQGGSGAGQPSDTDIAIVGMSAHLPGANTIDAYWQNLKNGVESIEFLSHETLLQHGERPDNLRKPNYVPATAMLPQMADFDGDFFGFSPKECSILDPQHRHFLECAWEALEDAAHPPSRFAGPIGCFGGCGMGSYFYFNLCSNPDLVSSVGMFLLRHTGNDKDFLVTRVSYLLDLKGPTIGVQTACSTSLVAVHLACQSLLSGECDMALAGGVTIEIPHGRGYLYNEGEILSPDGHCHAFDHRAQGTVFGSGAGVVVLRRLQDAIDDGDHIHAVIKGSAVNNDGARKVGYLAPSVDGQAAAMTEAYAVANVEPSTIDYVECHGTGTYMGDPIEIQALSQAFGGHGEAGASPTCRIGSVKTNIGHLDTAAGVASLIKVALALTHKQIPPSLNFERPNPTIDFGSTPFVVNAALTEWAANEHPRRAAVNSLGVGGTNAHALVEEAPVRPPSSSATRPYQIIALSAKSRAALDGAAARLAAHLKAHPDVPLADVAYTLVVGRRGFEKRRVLACRDHDEAIRLLETSDAGRVFNHSTSADRPSAVFMFPGGGSQYPRMAFDLYAAEPSFRASIDRGLQLLEEKHGLDLRPLWFADPENLEHAAAELKRTSVQLPALFILEHALAELWMSWGIKPSALLGHSLGENTAAAVAGVLSYEATLGLVVLRGRLYDRVAGGGMLSVPLPADRIEPLLTADLGLDLAIVNTPDLSVVSGRTDALDAFERTLRDMGIEPQRLRISVAGHSRMLDTVLDEFRAYLSTVTLSPPKIPIVSNLTGTWLTDQQATDPNYFVEHLRHTVLFSDGVRTLQATPGRVFIEVGPGRTLSSLVKAHPDSKGQVNAFPSLRHPEEPVSDEAFFASMVGRAWASGLEVDWNRMWPNEQRHRVRLPTYAFQRQRYFIEPKEGRRAEEDYRFLQRLESIDDFGFAPRWKLSLADREPSPPTSTWLIFLDEAGISEALAERLRQDGHRVTTVREGDAYHRRSDNDLVLSPERGEGYEALVNDLIASGRVPSRIVHGWMITRGETFRPGSSFFHRNQEHGFYSLLFLAKALAVDAIPRPLHITCLSNGMQSVGEEPLRWPDKASMLGPVKVIPREFPGITVSSIDVEVDALKPLAELSLRPVLELFKLPGRNERKAAEDLIDALLDELLSRAENSVIAYRDRQRWIRTYVPNPLAEGDTPSLVHGGTYFITGGLGGIGLAVAEHLAHAQKANLILVGRTPLPARSEWASYKSRRDADDRTRRRIERIQAIESVGSSVMVVAADVTDLEEMTRAVESAIARFGTIHGVFHTAGIVKDDLIVSKRVSDIEDVFAPKIQGTLVLEELFRDRPIDLLVLFSSTSTIIAPAGQVDYVAANDFLNAYARSERAFARRTLAIDWGIWSDVGLAFDALTGRRSPGTVEAANHPLFDARWRSDQGLSTFRASYSPTTHWMLNEHRSLNGHAIVPGTGYLEIARAALSEYGEKPPFEIRDLFFLRPLHIEDDASKEVRVALRRTEEGYTFETRSACMFEGQKAWELHASGLIALTPPARRGARIATGDPSKADEAAAMRLDIEAIEARCTRERTKDNPMGIRTPQENHLRFGPRWRVLRQVMYGDGEAIAQLALPPEHIDDLEAFALHPALLDLATGYGMKLIEGYEGDPKLWVPVSYRVVRVHAALTPHIRSWVRNHVPNSVKNDFASFDIVITDETGRILVEVEEFTIKQMKTAIDFGLATEPSRSEVEFAESITQRKLSPAEEQLLRNLDQGIRASEGMALLDRALGAKCGPLPEIVISSMSLEQLLKQTEQSTREHTASKEDRFSRPKLDNDFVPPRDDVERTLASFWEELLGVEDVGVKDSFFDLGGHSLIAVRLFANVKRAFQVEYPISVLFEAPTIETCATLIKEAMGRTTESQPDQAEAGSVASASANASSSSKARRSRYTHLVAMHAGEGGPKPPFFLVAGMFGNVLNLRQLAAQIGTDRPLYGLQARGLYGDQKPHETFEEAAHDYLQEVRSIQPSGPYLLGGFSGGGITAYEMAQQLRKANEDVALLVFLDTLLPIVPQADAKDRLRIQWMKLRRQGPSYISEWGRNRFRWELEKVRRRLQTPGELEHTPDEFQNEAIESAFRRALTRYHIQPYEGRVVLFRPRLDRQFVLGPNRATNADRFYVFEDNGWGAHVRQLEIHEVPGDHDSMILEPNVRVTTSKLRRLLDEAAPVVPVQRERDFGDWVTA